MAGSDEGEDDVRPGRSRIATAGAIGAGLLVVALGAAWIERTPIVAHFVDRTLADRHVAARYDIVAIGPFAQALDNVSIGDPRAPDLTARHVEITLGYGSGGPYLAGVRAEGVRLAARLIDGKVSFGAVDRLLPAPSNAPFALPDILLSLADAQVRLATPAGTIDTSISGDGRLTDGFVGRLAAHTARIAAGGCRIDRAAADLRVAITARSPHVTGPLDLAALVCANGLATGAGRATLDMAFAPTLDRWRGDLALDGFAGRAPGARYGPLSGTVTVGGSAARIEGRVQLAAANVAARDVSAARATLAGRYRYAPHASGLVYAGDIGLAHAALSPARRQAIVEQAKALGSTPAGPLFARAAGAVAALASDADATATVALTVGGPAGPAAHLRRLVLTGRNGAAIRLEEGDGFGWNLKEHGWRADGHVTTAGGGLPTLDLVLHQAHAGAPVSGTLRLVPYASDGARLAITPLRFVRTGADTRFDTVATLDGPLGSAGHVTGFTVPLIGHVGGGGFALGLTCTPIAVRALALGGIVIEDAHVRGCGIDGKPITSLTPDGYFGVGMTLDAVRLAGRSGAAPLTIAIGHVTAAPYGFAAEKIAIRLGRDDAVTAFDIGHLDSGFIGGFSGSFADAGGSIAHVPLVMSGAAGDWDVDGGTLRVTGALAVADAAATPRFRPMAGRDVALTLAGGTITATGTLHEPNSGAKVADVAIRHDLSSEQGGAVLTVPGLTFTKALQPDTLTPLTLGVVANVAGTVTGRGVIDWTAKGVTSSGDFATDKIDLAAAFGPVTGIAGQIHFSDLLGLVTPPHQSATIAEVNPGIAVTDGVAHYQLLPDQKIAVEDARWPFAGGQLTLDPSVLEFAQDSERHLTFRVTKLDAAAFVQQLAFPNLSATGTFDGTLPMIFDAKGGRIAGGRIVARPPGGTIAYLGELSQEKVGAMGKLAFDALKAIRYSSLSIGLDGRLDGEIVSRVGFTGVRQATPDASYAARLIHNLPFRFNIAIRAPFRSLLGTARSYFDPSLLLSGGLPQPGDTVSVAPGPGAPSPIQPAESEPVR